MMAPGPERDELIRTMRAEGRTAGHIAQSLGTTDKYVYLELRRLGLSDKRSPLRIVFTEAEDDYIRQARTQNPPMRWVDIKKHLGYSLDTLMARAWELGVRRSAAVQPAPTPKADDLRHNRLPLPPGSPETWGVIANGYAFPGVGA